MLPTLATHWSLLLFRGSIAVTFGMSVLFWPQITLTVLIALFGAYAFADGCVALTIAVGAKGVPGFASLLFDGLVRIGAALAVFVAFPVMTDVSLAIVIASWAILSGLAEIAAALTLRRELSGEWPLPTAGVLSVGVGLLMMLRADAGAVALAWLIALYGIVVGCALIALAMRLRQVAHEIANARPG
jgi:uncharacterized membrane protein HdeD (DUF308 family)